MIRALLARALTTITSALFGVFTARLILGEAGVEYYAAYSLITTLPALLQFTDLGSGAALVNVIAASPDPEHDHEVEVTITSVGRVMVGFATVVMVLSVILFASGSLERMLGDMGALPNAPLAAFVSLAAFAVSIPLGVWQRVLLGLRRNHQTVLIQGMAGPINFAVVWCILQLGATGHSFLAVSFYLTAFIVAMVGLFVARRSLPRTIVAGFGKVLSPRRYPGVRVMDVGWPMLAQMLSTPLALTSQRYVLAQFASADVVAEYTAAGQVFLSFMGMINAAGLALWPQFAQQRAAGGVRTGPHLLSPIFGLGATALLALVWLVREPLFDFTTNGKIPVQTATIVAFGLMIVLQACLYPLGMFIMDKPGIRFQMIPTMTMAVSSLALSIVITPAVGLVGPILSNCLCVLFAQIIPFSIYIRRHWTRLIGSVGV